MCGSSCQFNKFEYSLISQKTNYRANGSKLNKCWTKKKLVSFVLLFYSIDICIIIYSLLNMVRSKKSQQFNIGTVVYVTYTIVICKLLFKNQKYSFVQKRQANNGLEKKTQVLHTYFVLCTNECRTVLLYSSNDIHIYGRVVTFGSKTYG